MLISKFWRLVVDYWLNLKFMRFKIKSLKSGDMEIAE